jgi:hypothetical protein
MARLDFLFYGLFHFPNGLGLASMLQAAKDVFQPGGLNGLDGHEQNPVAGILDRELRSRPPIVGVPYGLGQNDLAF